LGIEPASLGPEHERPVELSICSAITFGKAWQGEVLFVDDFGNIITNIPACKLKSQPARVKLGGSAMQAVRWVRTYTESAPGELVGLPSSDGLVEFAEVNGNAARRLGIAAGAAVELELS
jgi:S-adenosylmethionine hydrolase